MTSVLAVVLLVHGTAEAGDKVHKRGPGRRISVPELNVGTAGTALGLVAAGVAVALGRRRRTERKD